MPRTDEEDESDDFDEREFPEDDEADWNMDPADEKCPQCGGDITEDTVRCPHCGNYVSAEESPARRRPLWMAIGIILIVAALVAFFIMR
jgi:predicted nucleic acid-binding Zn ribbon protein